MENKKLIYGFTKSKAYGLCGVALAMAFLGAGSVSADEASATPATIVTTQSQPESEVSPLEKADLIVNDVKNVESEVVVPATENLNSAVNSAKEVGLEVSEGQVVDKGVVKSAEEEATKVKEIEADYAKQAESIKKEAESYKKATEDYKKADEVYKAELAKREEALKNPDYHTASDAFPKQDINSFLQNTDLTKLSYVVLSDKTPAKLESNLKKVTAEELKAVFDKAVKVEDNPKRDLANLEAGKNIGYYHVKVGDSWFFKDAFVDAATGKKISLKYTYQGGEYRGEKINETILVLLDGMNVTGLGQEEHNLYKIDFVDETGKVATVDNVLLGFGDLDYGQYIGVYSDALDKERYLAGSAQTVTQDKNGLVSTSRKDFSAATSAETAGQFWVLVKGASGFEYKFGEPPVEPYKVRTEYVGGQWHQVGNVEFGIDIPPVPVAPVKPEAKKLAYNLESYAKKGDLKVRVETTDGFVFDEKSYADLFVDSSFDTSKTKDNLITINGRTYRIVEIKGQESDKIELGTKEVVYVVKQQVTTTWIKEGGEPLKDPHTGDETEPHGEFPELVFVKTNIKPDGSVEHVFKEVEKPKEEPQKATPTPVVNKPEQPNPVQETPKVEPTVQKAAAATLPETGTTTSVLGFLGSVLGALGFGVGRKKKEN